VQNFELGIESIGVYTPEKYIDNIEQGLKYDTGKEFIENKIGALKLPRLADDETVTSACVKSFLDLQSKSDIDLNDVECIIVCTQTPDKNGIPHTSALIQAEIGAPENCACFDISLGCSGYVYGMQVIASFMQMHNMKKGLLFTCDPYSKILDKEDKNTSLLFGDAATVTLVSEIPRFVSETVTFSTRGTGASALTKESGHLYMNGRSVFNFALTDVPKQIRETINKSSFAKEEIDLFLLHQGSRFMVENAIKKISGVDDRAPVDIENTGNTVSSSIPLLLNKHLNNEKLNTFLMSGFGVGLSWATAIYKRKEV